MKYDDMIQYANMRDACARIRESVFLTFTTALYLNYGRYLVDR